MENTDDTTILLLLFIPLALILILFINVYLYLYLYNTKCCRKRSVTDKKISKYIEKNTIVKKHGSIFDYERNSNICVECSICYKKKYKFLFYNNYGRFIITECNHIICCSCAKIWIKINPICPVCRTEIIVSGFYNIIL